MTLERRGTLEEPREPGIKGKFCLQVADTGSLGSDSVHSNVSGENRAWEPEQL